MEAFAEIKPGKRYLTRIYLGIMLWFVGRAVQAAAKVDKDVAKEFENMPDEYTFSLGAFPNGPYMIVGKDAIGRVRYKGGNPDKHDIHLEMGLKSTGNLFTMFTFRESTPVANARDRLFVCGDVPHACACVRVLDIVQVYLLPKPIAKLAIKRYPRWSFKRHTLDRALVLIRTIIGL
ncbi:MAG: hypothetical protein MI802_05220 [Desulfobacterales bacterium]|nr:hypothetical protein [Desulfobacterales bacterium]